jgi:hypothetical protein
MPTAASLAGQHWRQYPITEALPESLRSASISVRKQAARESEPRCYVDSSLRLKRMASGPCKRRSSRATRRVALYIVNVDSERSATANAMDMSMITGTTSHCSSDEAIAAVGPTCRPRPVLETSSQTRLTRMVTLRYRTSVAGRLTGHRMARHARVSVAQTAARCNMWRRFVNSNELYRLHRWRSAALS